MIKVCFVVPHAYSLFEPSIIHPFGGSEVQTWILAKGLSRLNEYQVSYIVLDHKQPKRKKYGAIFVYRHSVYADYTKPIDAYRDHIMGIPFKQKSFPFIAFSGKTPFMFYESFYVRSYDFIDSLYRKLNPPVLVGKYEIHPSKFYTYKEINADFYITSGVHELSAEVSVFCERFGKKHILLAASDYDFCDVHTENNWATDRYMNFGHMCWYSIMHASQIVTQTDHQAELLSTRYGRASTVITNPVDLLSAVTAPSLYERKYALWVGKADDVKRPDLLIELASLCPEIDFIMVMNPSNRDIFKQTLQSRPKNVEILEYVPFHEMETYFSKSFILLNTSVFEGFPNTFLQAGKYRMPILSLNVNPDGYIQDKMCGIWAEGDFQKFVAALKDLNSNREKAEIYGQNGYNYILQNHNLNDKVTQLCQLFSRG